MKKILFVLAVAALAAAVVSDLSEQEEPVTVSAADSPTTTFLKTKLNCLKKQVKVCEKMLAKAEKCKKGKKRIIIAVSNLTWLYH